MERKCTACFGWFESGIYSVCPPCQAQRFEEFQKRLPAPSPAAPVEPADYNCDLELERRRYLNRKTIDRSPVEGKRFSEEEIENALKGNGFSCDCGREDLPAIVRQLQADLKAVTDLSFQRAKDAGEYLLERNKLQTDLAEVKAECLPYVTVAYDHLMFEEDEREKMWALIAKLSGKGV